MVKKDWRAGGDLLIKISEVIEAIRKKISDGKKLPKALVSKYNALVKQKDDYLGG